METIDEHASAHPPSSPDMQPSDLLKSNISQVSVTALLAPLTHAQTLSGSVNSVEYSNKSNRTVLIRAVKFFHNLHFERKTSSVLSLFVVM